MRKGDYRGPKNISADMLVFTGFASLAGTETGVAGAPDPEEDSQRKSCLWEVN